MKGKRWFRFYAEALDDPKVQKLPPHLFKVWVNVLCVASANGGVLPSAGDLAFRLRMSEHDAGTAIDELIDLGLVDILPDKRLTPHNWDSRQFESDTSAARTKKWRNNKKIKASDDDVTSHVTAPEQNRAESETETDKPPNPRTDVTDQDRVRFAQGRLTLFGDLKIFWLEKFANDATRLDLALIEIAGRIQTAGNRPLEAQVSSGLARIVADKRDRDTRYQAAAKSNAKTNLNPFAPAKTDWAEVARRAERLDSDATRV